MHIALSWLSIPSCAELSWWVAPNGYQRGLGMLYAEINPTGVIASGSWKRTEVNAGEMSVDLSYAFQYISYSSGNSIFD